MSRQIFNTAQIAYFAAYGFKILCELSKVPFEITHQKLNPYTTKYAFHCLLILRVIFYDIFELWHHKP